MFQVFKQFTTYFDTTFYIVFQKTLRLINYHIGFYEMLNQYHYIIMIAYNRLEKFIFY